MRSAVQCSAVQSVSLYLSSVTTRHYFVASPHHHFCQSTDAGTRALLADSLASSLRCQNPFVSVSLHRQTPRPIQNSASEDKITRVAGADCDCLPHTELADLTQPHGTLSIWPTTTRKIFSLTCELRITSSACWTALLTMIDLAMRTKMPHPRRQLLHRQPFLSQSP